MQEVATRPAIGQHLLPKLLCRFRDRTGQNVVGPGRKMTWCTQNITSSYFTLWYFYISCFIFISCLSFILRDNKYEINKIRLSYPQPRSQHSPTRLSLRPWGRVGQEPGIEVESHLLTLPPPSSIDPHFQNEAKCTTFSCENKFYWDENEKSFPYQRLST